MKWKKYDCKLMFHDKYVVEMHGRLPTYYLSSPLDEGRPFLFLGKLAKKKHLQISVTKNLFIIISIVACAIGPSVNPLLK
jgi:hypothetical protein